MTFLFCILLANYYFLYKSFDSKEKGEINRSHEYNRAYTVVQVVLTTAINCILIYSVNRIRKVIKSKDYMDPNEKFAFIHMVNFFLDSVGNLV